MGNEGNIIGEVKGSLNRLNDNIPGFLSLGHIMDSYCCLNRGEGFRSVGLKTKGIKWECYKGFFNKYSFKHPCDISDYDEFPPGINVIKEPGEMPTGPYNPHGIEDRYAYQPMKVIIEVPKDYSKRKYDEYFNRISVRRDIILQHFDVDYEFLSDLLKNNKSWGFAVSLSGIGYTNSGNKRFHISFKDDLQMENLPRDSKDTYYFPSEYTITIGRIILEEITNNLPEVETCEINYEENKEYHSSSITISNPKKEPILGKW